MKKGFTLIELSIVLVIIGLLVGGILVGQSLVNSARISNFISYAGQLDTAIIQFQERYKCLPGDCSKLGGPGNDSGHIGIGRCGIPQTIPGDCYAGPGITDLNPEAIYFWQHLSLSGFKPDGVVYDINYTNSSDGVAGVNYPEINIFSGQEFIVINRYLNGQGWPGNPPFANWIRATRNNISFNSLDSRRSGSLANPPGVGGFVKPATLLAIDNKIDDGHPVLGRIILDPTDSREFGACDTNSFPIVYNLDNEERACSVNIGIGFTIGNFNLYTDEYISAYGY